MWCTRKYLLKLNVCAPLLRSWSLPLVVLVCGPVRCDNDNKPANFVVKLWKVSMTIHTRDYFLSGPNRDGLFLNFVQISHNSCSLKHLKLNVFCTKSCMNTWSLITWKLNRQLSCSTFSLLIEINHKTWKMHVKQWTPPSRTWQAPPVNL